MPLVQITMYAGRPDEKKEELIKKVTDTVAEVLGCPTSAVTVVLQDIPRANWGQAGVVTSKKS